MTREEVRMSMGKRIITAVAILVLSGLPGLIPAQSLPSDPYAWSNVVIGGGGFVTGIIVHPRQKGLMYARTDVGGAYRWDTTAQRWIPITDGIGDVDFTGIESLAVDPSDPNRVYLAAGIYSRGKAAILRSADQGRTWLHTDVPFKMGGNESGRFNGERLAVDPNNGAILFFGSRRDGLWKSVDRGSTWRRVIDFPDIGSHETALADAAESRPWFGFNQQPVGIVCVVFDAATSRLGQPTPTLYAAVSTTETNLYRSIDCGATWLPVADQPVGLRPNHLVRAADGMFYLSYGKEPGPNAMTDGAVWKFNPKNGRWTDITPLKPAGADQPFGYGAVAADLQHPSTILAATFAHWKPCDEIFRSTNGGASWMPLLTQAGWDHAAAPYTQNLKPHWLGNLVINPFNSDQVLFVTGYGIWSSRNMTEADAGQPTRWTFLDNGLEETVPLALLSPPEGAHLLSGVGDIDGFRHDDLNRSPAQGAFDGPRYSNTEDMALAGKNPRIIVRTGTGRNNTVRAAISTDGGKTWGREIILAAEPGGGGLRPGMPVVTRLGGGKFIAVYEVVGIGDADVFCKISADGERWPAGLGNHIGGQHAGPWVTSLSSDELLLTSCANRLSASRDSGATWVLAEPSAWTFGAGKVFTWPAIYEIATNQIAVMISRRGVQMRFGSLGGTTN